METNTSKLTTRKIGIIGWGYVGKAVTRMFATHYPVRIYDPYIKQLDVEWQAQFHDVQLNKMEELKQCALIVICVPTPSAPNGRCDTTIVEETVKDLANMKFNNLVMIKSTVEPKTTDRLNRQYGLKMIFSPEFAGESTYWSPYAFDKDMKAMPYVILGGEREYTSAIIDILMPILGPKKTYAQTDSTTAEMVKYWENVFFATKVTFMNEMYEICRVFGVDYNEARELWGLDPRVEKMHTSVFKGKRGYAGKCFPKDTKALYSASKEFGYEPQVIKQVIRSNDAFLKMNKDNENKSRKE